MSQCSICQRPVAPRTENKAFPFCSPRCKTIDLGHWVDQTYRVPDEADALSFGGGSEDDAAGGERLSPGKA
jgi:endogenous inhibitor of DNA gyrase (YacG/DUF329 family)